jgi:hypothetical protein
VPWLCAELRMMLRLVLWVLSGGPAGRRWEPRRPGIAASTLCRWYPQHDALTGYFKLTLGHVSVCTGHSVAPAAQPEAHDRRLLLRGGGQQPARFPQCKYLCLCYALLDHRFLRKSGSVSLMLT